MAAKTAHKQNKSASKNNNHNVIAASSSRHLTFLTAALLRNCVTSWNTLFDPNTFLTCNETVCTIIFTHFKSNIIAKKANDQILKKLLFRNSKFFQTLVACLATPSPLKILVDFQKHSKSCKLSMLVVAWNTHLPNTPSRVKMSS